MGNNAIEETGRSIACKKLDLVYQRYSFSFVSSLLISSTLAVMLWPMVAHATLMAWLLTLWSVMAARNFYARRYLRLMPDVDLGKWRSGLVAGAAAAGACWGLSVFFLSVSPLDPAALPLIFVIAVVTTFASVTMAAERLAVVAFLLAALLPLALWLALSGDRLHVYMALITLTYTGLMLLFSREINRVIRNSLSTSELNKEISAAIKQVRALEYAVVQKESERRYAELFANFEDIIFFVDVVGFGEFRIASVNPAAERAFGIKDADVRGKLKRDLFHEDVSARLESYDQACVDSGKPVHYEEVLDDPSGSRYFSITHIPMFDETGRVVRIASIARDVTLLKQNEMAQQKHAELEQRLSCFNNNAPGFFYTARLYPDGRSNMPFASPRIRELFGLSPDSVAQSLSPLFSMGHPDDIAVLFERRQESARTLCALQCDFRIVHPEKGECWIELNSMPHKEDDGSTVWHGFMQDITGRKRMEAQLKMRESEFRTLTENAADPICRYDSDCRSIYVNPAFMRISGQQLVGLLGKRPTEAMLVPSDESVKVELSIRRVLDTGMPDEIEVLFIAPDGRELYFQNMHVPEFGEYGTVESVLSIGRDTTSRRRMEEVLHKSEHEYRTLSENSPDNIVRYDRECRIRYLNKNAAAALGLSAAYMLRKASTEVFSDGLFDELERVLKSVIESGQPAEHYVTLPDRGEGERYQHLRMMPEKNERGDVTGVLSIGRDITEQKRIGDALKEKEQRLSSFISSAPGFFFTLNRRQDGSMSMPFASVGITDIVGLLPEDVALGVEPLVSIYHPDDVEGVQRKVALSGQNLEPCHAEFRVLNHQKGVRWIEARSMPHRDEAGNTFWHGFMQDVTERKLNELVLLERAEQEQRQSKFFEVAPGFFYTSVRQANGHNAMPFASPAIRDLFGLEPEDVAQNSEPLLALIHLDDREQRLRKIEESRCNLTRLHYECRYYHPKMGVRWLEAHSLPKILPDGCTRWDGFMHDITARKLAQQRQEMLDTAVNHSSDAIYLIDKKWRFRYVNATACRSLGYSCEELQGMGIFDIDPLVTREMLLDGGARLDAGEKLPPMESLHRARDGREFPVEISSSLVEHNGEKFSLAVVRDITGRKFIEKMLQDSEKMLQDAQRIAHVGSWEVDLVNDKLVWSEEVFRIWEIDKAQFEANFAAFLETVHPEDRERVVLAYNDTILNRTLYEVEHRLLFSDGRIKYILERGEPEYDAQGKPVRFIGTALDITERKCIEAALAISEREFRSLAGNLPDNIARWDVEGRYLYINPVHERTLGVAASEVIGKPLPNTHEHVKVAIAQVVATGQEVELVRQLVPVNGEIQIHEVSLVPERDATGRIISVLGLGRNMTEFYRMQETIVAREAEFRALVEQAPEPIFRYGLDGRRIYANAAVERITGIPANVLLGGLSADGKVIHADSGAALTALVKRICETGVPGEIEVENVGADGRLRYFNNRLAPEFGADGKVRSVFSICHDITERKLMEEEINNSRNLLNKIIDSIPDPIFVKDREHRWVFSNEAFSNLLGQPREELIGKSDYDFLPKEQADVFWDKDELVFNSGETNANEEALTGCDGDTRYLHTKKTPFVSADGQAMLVGVIRDITERKRTEDVLKFIAEGEWLSSGEAFLHALVRYLGKMLGVDYVVLDKLSADHAYVETTALYAKGEILPNMQYALQGTPCEEVMAGKSCCYADDVRGLFPGSGVLAKMQAESYVGVPLLNVEGRVIGLIAALDSQPMADANAVKSVLQLVATSAAAELVRTQMEGILRDSHESLNEAQRISRVGNWELDLASGALLWSDEIYRIFEIDPAQFGASYEAFINAIHPDDREAVSHAYRESLENRAPYEIEHRLLMADGRITYVHERCETLYAEDGRPLRSTGTVQDISARRLAKEALRASEEKIRSLFALSPLGIALTDMNGKYIEFNEAFRAICGYPTDELMLLDYWTLTPREYESREGEQLESLSRTGLYGPYEKEYRQKDGRRIPIQLNGVLMKGDDGMDYIWSIVEDITERKRSEALLTERLAHIHGLNIHLEENARNLEEQTVELEASQEQIKQTEEWYRSILHSAPDGMMVVDDRGVIMQVNERFAAMFGYEEGELSGRDIEMLLPHAARESHVGMRNAFLARKDDYRDAMVGKTLFGCRKDSSEFPVDVSLSRLPELAGRRRAICASVRDVSERHAMEVAREAALAEAMRLAQLRSAFMGQMSHELRTPLNGILGHAQNLLHGGALGEKQISGLNIIQHSGEHLLSLINGILDHAAIEADKFELIPGDIQFETFLASIIGIIRISVEQKNLGFSCVADDNLPAVVRGDAQRLRQVLLNLLANAIKFTDRGQVTLRVDYSAPSRLRFAVQDSGVGIGIDQQENIFQPFEQVGETRRRAGGTGLGLAISRKLVRLMGGDIVVESQPGAGSTFSFEIEMEKDPSDSARVNAAALSGQAETRVAQATMTLPVPPRQELEILHGLALRGSMRDIMRHAEKLAEADGRYLPFVEQLRQLAKNFQTKALLSLIEQYRSEQEIKS